MEQILISVENSSYTNLLMQLLKELKFVRSTKKVSIKNGLPVSKFISKEDFWETFGTGKDSALNIEQIREKAWRKIPQQL